jgi:sigma-E factor negative regulatory protein RseB
MPLLRRVLRAADGSTTGATRWVAAGGCVALLFSYVLKAADDDPRSWLARTDQALSKRNYEGVFVHEHGGDTEILRVIHRVGSDGVSERLLSMDGSGREFIRRGTQLMCYLPDRRTVLVEKSSEPGLLLTSLPRLDVASAAPYQITELARTRASGRPVRVIAITPMDAMRYGYRVWVDEASAMPLKTQLRSRSGDVLEQLVFTDLRLPAHIADAELQPSVDARTFRWVHQDAESGDAGALPVSWQASVLPPGFHLTRSARQTMPDGPVEHLVFSDGIASVSVFVSIAREPEAVSHEDAVTLGSSAAYATAVEGYRVTAVGEVPLDTVRLIAQSLRVVEAVPASPATDVYSANAHPPPPAWAEPSRASIFEPGPPPMSAAATSDAGSDKGAADARSSFSGSTLGLGPATGLAPVGAGPGHR